MRYASALLRVMTDELAGLLAPLSPQQARAIAAIVEAGHLTERTLAPWSLLDPENDKRIASHETFYRRGKWDDEQGRWLVTPGWAHQPAFVLALNTAKRLARQATTAEQIETVARAVGRAKALALDAVENGRDIMECAEEPRDRLAAAKWIVELALADGGPAESESAEADWWKAASDQ